MQSSAFHFRPEGRPDVVYAQRKKAQRQRPGWKLSARIAELSRNSRRAPYEILLTSDLCINVLDDGLPLTIVRHQDEVSDGDNGWLVEVGELARRIGAVSQRMEPHLHDASEADADGLGRSMTALDAILFEVLTPDLSRLTRVRPPGGLREAAGEEALMSALFRGSRSGIALAKYLALMTFVWPAWRRITMVPQVGPVFGHAQPGGVVVCEDSPRERAMAAGDFDAVAALTSATMWPWLALQLQDEGEDFEPLQTIEDKLRRVRNDYRGKEQALGLGRFELVDTKDDAHLSNGEESEARKIRSQRQQVKGIFLATQPAQGVSIVIPVLGNAVNLCECLKSIRRQTFFREHPSQVEIIIVQDGDVANEVNPLDCRKVRAALRALTGAEIQLFRLAANKGRATARNVGIQHARKSILLFVDASMILEGHFLTEHMIRHSHIPGLALLGFKTNLSRSSYDAHASEIEKGTLKPNFRDDWKVSHVLRDGEAPFGFRRTVFYPGAPINYMEETQFLRELHGVERIGYRTLATFFQTNIVSVETSKVKQVGGFEIILDVGWGYEDSFLGACLLASGVMLVPCPSSVAFKIDHEDADDKEESIRNKRVVYETLIRTTRLGSRSAETLERSVDRLRMLGVLKDWRLEPRRVRPSRGGARRVRPGLSE